LESKTANVEVGNNFVVIDDDLEMVIHFILLFTTSPCIGVNKHLMMIGAICRNPTLAKCGGEAQHLEKVRIWSPPGLPNVQSSTARPKTPCIEVSFVPLERS
jgi:hypothetical protein